VGGSRNTPWPWHPGRKEKKMKRNKLWKKDVEMAQNENIPIYEARALEDGVHLIFWCPWCCKDHLHGKANMEPFRPSHRIAHCSYRYEAHKKGYYIFYSS